MLSYKISMKDFIKVVKTFCEWKVNPRRGDYCINPAGVKLYGEYRKNISEPLALTIIEELKNHKLGISSEGIICYAYRDSDRNIHLQPTSDPTVEEICTVNEHLARINALAKDIALGRKE